MIEALENLPSPEHLQLIQFEGGTVAVVAPEDYETLFRGLAAEKQRRLYWQGVVRGARAELHQMERITLEEYAALCSDTECRDYVDQMDKLKEQRDELLGALERIRDLRDAPAIDATGDFLLGLHCGVEDRDLHDRYECAEYGHTVGVERSLEWASNEARAAIVKVKGQQ